MLDADEAETVLSYLETYRYASAEHVTLGLLWHTVIRRGAAHGLDVEDYHPEDRYLEVVHRPETGTPIKNGKRGERLLASSRGRLARSTIGKYCYRWTRPCTYGTNCPHGRDPETCEATENGRESTCPSSVSAHPFRRGSIAHHLKEDVPETAVGDRATVG